MYEQIAQIQTQVDELQKELEQLKYKETTDIQQHQHGADASSTTLDSILGLFEVTSTVPTLTPKGVNDQIKIYINGATYRLYCYDYKAHTWHYATLT